MVCAKLSDTHRSAEDVKRRAAFDCAAYTHDYSILCRQALACSRFGADRRHRQTVVIVALHKTVQNDGHDRAYTRYHISNIYTHIRLVELLFECTYKHMYAHIIFRWQQRAHFACVYAYKATPVVTSSWPQFAEKV